jgi:exoribonuclease II
MSSDPQYTVTIRNLNFEPIVEYTDIIADGLIQGTTIKWMLRDNRERLEFSLNCFVAESSAARQNMVDDQQTKYIAEQVAQQAKYEAEMANIQQGPSVVI